MTGRPLPPPPLRSIDRLDRPFESSGAISDQGPSGAADGRADCGDRAGWARAPGGGGAERSDGGVTAFGAESGRRTADDRGRRTEGRSARWAGRSAGGRGLAAKRRKRRKKSDLVTEATERGPRGSRRGAVPNRSGVQGTIAENTKDGGRPTEHTEGFLQKETEENGVRRTEGGRQIGQVGRALRARRIGGRSVTC